MNQRAHYLPLLLRPVGVSLIGLILASCASQTTVSSKWVNKADAGTPYGSVLVVGVSGNAENRISFEKAVAEDLRKNGVRARISALLMAPEEDITEPRLRELAASEGASGIVVTRVLNMEINPVEIGGRSTVLAEQQQSGFDHTYRRKQGTLFQYDYEEDIEATYLSTEYTVELQTDVYQATSGNRIYTLRSATAKQETLKDVIAVLSDEIARRLRRDKVIN